MPVAVVTDSTASIPAAVVAERGIVVVPLQVVVGDRVMDEVLDEVPDDGDPVGATPRVVADALRAHTPVSTSRPSPSVLGEVYRRVAAAGATEIVSVHLSGQISGTVESAQVAARSAPVPVTPVDTGQVGVATGYAALAACDVVERGGSAAQAAAAARARAALCTSLFYVDTLDHLRRGGRIGRAAALLGGALAVKPLLTIADGVVAPLERVRTSARALGRLADLAVEAAGTPDAEHPVDLCVAHLASRERAEELAGQLGERLADRLAGREVWCTELGAVLGAHVGPGMLAVCVAPTLGP